MIHNESQLTLQSKRHDGGKCNYALRKKKNHFLFKLNSFICLIFVIIFFLFYFSGCFLKTWYHQEDMKYLPPFRKLALFFLSRHFLRNFSDGRIIYKSPGPPILLFWQMLIVELTFKHFSVYDKMTKTRSVIA